MPARYVHVLTAAAMDVGFGCILPGPTEGYEVDEGYTTQSVGAIMLTSSNTGCLGDYAVCHSRMHYQMLPFGGGWTYLGTAAEHLGVTHQRAACEQTIRWVLGRSYTEAHVQKPSDDHRGESICEYYVRSSHDEPQIRYALYHLTVWRPSDFYRAQGWRYIRDVDLHLQE